MDQGVGSGSPSGAERPEDEGSDQVRRLRELQDDLRSSAGNEQLLERLGRLESRIREASRSDKPMGGGFPEATPTGPPRRLTIGMACYDDFDGVFFTANAIRLYHPEVLEETEILVVDNAPWRPEATALKDLENSVANYRYVPAADVRGTAIRDRVFRESNSEWVMVVDAHVMLEPGSLRRFLDHVDAAGDSPDLYQGPMYGPQQDSVVTHLEPDWRAGMWGTWATDERGTDMDAKPFEIPMQGLGLFACRRKLWPGFNPRFRGFGGEEGYIHEKVRQRGGRTICLPFLRWLHRFPRPSGVPYPLNWEERVRNYLIGHEELGLDPTVVTEHFGELIGELNTRRIVESATVEMANPFWYFDAIFCLNLDHQEHRWELVRQQFEELGLAGRVERFPAIETPDNHHVGCAMSHRAVVAMAQRRGLDNVLVIEDDAVLRRDALERLAPSMAELRALPSWDVLYLGAHSWHGPPAKLSGLERLRDGHNLHTTHAVAYNSRFFDRLLEEIPTSTEEVGRWIHDGPGAIDQWLAALSDGDVYAVEPFVAIQPWGRQNLDPEDQRAYPAV